jgi:DNA primase
MTKKYEDREFIAPLEEILSEQGVSFAPTASGWLTIDSCFNCGKAKKLAINAESGVFSCYKCGVKGGAANFLTNVLTISWKEACTILYGKNRAQSIKDEYDETEFQVVTTGTKNRKKRKVVLPKPVPRPGYMKDLKAGDTDAVNYLEGRGIPFEVASEIGLWHWESGKRIVFAIQLDGALYGHVARDYGGESEKKVLNLAGTWRSFTVWNYDAAREADEVVVAEGIFSAIKGGGVGLPSTGPSKVSGIALLGKSATPGQLEVIKTLNAKKIYICLDVGTDEEQWRLFKQLSADFPGLIYKIEMPHVIDNKGRPTGKADLCAKLNRRFGTEIEYMPELDYYELPYENKLKISSNFRFTTGMNTEEKIAKATRMLSEDKRLKLSEKEIKDACWLVLKAEYRDAGDCTFEEMAKLRAKASLFQGGPTNWI